MTQTTASDVAADSGLNLVLLLEDFQDLFRQHSERWEERHRYKEAGPQLLPQTFLQNVVKGGGRSEREDGLSPGRTEPLILWSQGSRLQRFVVECRVLRRSLASTIDTRVRGRRRATWTAAGPKPDISSSSTARTGGGKTSSSAGPLPAMA